VQLLGFPFPEPAAELMKALVNLIVGVDQVCGRNLEDSIHIDAYIFLDELIV
jgi:hypothetical protein